jgi:hypothetical protein
VCSVHRGPTPARTEGGGATERGKCGELGSGLTGARAALRRPGGDGAEREAAALGERVAQAGREGNRSR